MDVNDFKIKKFIGKIDKYEFTDKEIIELIKRLQTKIIKYCPERTEYYDKSPKKYTSMLQVMCNKCKRTHRDCLCED